MKNLSIRSKLLGVVVMVAVLCPVVAWLLLCKSIK